PFPPCLLLLHTLHSSTRCDWNLPCRHHRSRRESGMSLCFEHVLRPALVRGQRVAEAGPHQDVAPVDLRVVDQGSQLVEISLAQHEHREAHALEAGGVLRLAERQGSPALEPAQIYDTVGVTLRVYHI